MPPKIAKTSISEKGEVQCLVLQQKGNFRQSTISENTCEALGKVFRRAQNPELIDKYEYNEMQILLYGYKKGKDGTENKHELPPPHNDIKLFSDIALVSVGNDGKLKNMNHDIWSKFVNTVMGDDNASNDNSDSDDSNESAIVSDVEDDDESLSSDDSESELEEFEEEEEEVVKKKPRTVKKVSKKLPTFYSHKQLELESVDTDYVMPENVVRLKWLKVIQTKLNTLELKEQERIEQGIYNASIQTCKNKHIWTTYDNPDFISMYEITARKAVTNLDPTSYIGSTALFEHLKSGTYTASDIGSLGAYEMYPEKWKYMIEIQLKRDKHLLEGGTDLEYATDMFKCSRCGKRKCRYYEMQTRGADEPMTVFIKCLICKKEWKQ
jgi:hypothetical protein